MPYYSTNDHAHIVSLKEAVIRGQAPGKGLYFPVSIPVLPASFYEGLIGQSFTEVAVQVARQLFRNELTEEVIDSLVQDAINFDVPLIPIDDKTYSLELFHGPTLAFKDVGARFMARLLGHFLQEDKQEEVTVLVATSGDTGSAVANGFYNVPGIKVVLLYPSGKVSKIQEQQLTTLGGNINALEVEGVFDDCQALVKQAFEDDDLRGSMKLTSANSINIARLLPQSFYYHYAWVQLQQNEPGAKPVICVPSGNFGNLSAGLIAKRMGLPVQHFIAATNANSVVPEYFESGQFKPRPSVATISNAMDVGNPSNFPRMLELYENNYEAMTADISGYSFNDEQTRETMRKVHDKTGYILDPHGAVGYRALQSYLNDHPGNPGIVLETAHPAKFKDVVDETLDLNIELPPALQAAMEKPKTSIKISTDYQEFRHLLLAQD